MTEKQRRGRNLIAWACVGFLIFNGPGAALAILIYLYFDDTTKT